MASDVRAAARTFGGAEDAFVRAKLWEMQNNIPIEVDHLAI